MAVCAFCGKQFKGKTKDHVPPRGLFGAKPKGNLITVPACAKCNNDTSKDDEFFRVLALEQRASDHPTALEVSDTVYRSLFHPKKGGFKSLMFDMMEPVPLWTGSELYGRKLMKMSVPLARILPTVRKAMRGLYYTIKKQPVPADYAVKGYLLDSLLQGLPKDELDDLTNHVLPKLNAQPVTKVGEGVFEYRYVNRESNPNELYFLLRFYKRFSFFGFVVSSKWGEEPCEERGPKPMAAGDMPAGG